MDKPNKLIVDEDNEIWISIKENDLAKFVETSQQLHIPFTIKRNYTIDNTSII